MSGRVTLTLDSGAIAHLSAPGGMVDDYCAKLARQVATRARALAPVVTGKLRDAIQAGRGFGGWTVVANTEYAAAVAGGTRPHEIVPKRAQVLRFPTKGGTIVYTSKVKHPGTKPNEFLLVALREVVR